MTKPKAKLNEETSKKNMLAEITVTSNSIKKKKRKRKSRSKRGAEDKINGANKPEVTQNGKNTLEAAKSMANSGQNASPEKNLKKQSSDQNGCSKESPGKRKKNKKKKAHLEAGEVTSPTKKFKVQSPDENDVQLLEEGVGEFPIKKNKAKNGNLDSPKDIVSPGKKLKTLDQNVQQVQEGEGDNNSPAKKKKKKKMANLDTADTNASPSKKFEVPEGGKDEESPTKNKKKKKIPSSGFTVTPMKNNLVPKSPEKEEESQETQTKSKKKNKKQQQQPMNGLATLNSYYTNPSNKTEIKKHWMKDGSPLKKENGSEIIKTPFTCGYLPNFLEDAEFLKGIQEELKDITPLKKNNDLYKFTQTPDLKSSKKTHISSLREFLYGDFRNWLIEVTGIPLNEKVDMGSSTYEHTDVLLCHDDELEGRRIAYIIYLVPSWEESDGGTLDLYNTDKNGQPKDIVRSLIPQWNTFAFFEVSPVSFHQVAEVLSKDKKRLSINGWFHGPPISGPPKHKEVQKPCLPPVHIQEDDLYSWINPSYLDENTQRDIRRKFRADSEIELESFLSEEKYEELKAALKSQSLVWQKTGPANKNSYKRLKEKKHPEVVKECLNFLRSEAMFLILSQLTGLNLHKLAPPDSDPDSDEEETEPNPRFRTSVRKWSHGSYTLIRDCDSEEQESALDATLFVNVSKKWTESFGGYNSYIGKDEDDELLTVLPQSNCFALIYRDPETLKFTKYINAGVLDLKEDERNYFDIYCKYYE